MESTLYRALQDKIYDKRKAAALEVEKISRDSDRRKIEAIIGQLNELATSTNSNARIGGVMGLAGCSIALGRKIVYHLAAIVPPILACFPDADSKVRYFACESMYNVSKVAKGEILLYFNEIFDALSKLAADTELPVKNGAELLDRLIKDIVTERASTYVSALNTSSNEEFGDEEYENAAETSRGRDRGELKPPDSSTTVDTGGVLEAAGPSENPPSGGGSSKLNTHTSDSDSAQTSKPHQPTSATSQVSDFPAAKRSISSSRSAYKTAFSLERFIPLLRERIYVLSSNTRSYLVTWLVVLNSVPELELVSFLPEFLDGLLGYLADPQVDVRTATQNLLQEFLNEIGQIAESERVREEKKSALEEIRNNDGGEEEVEGSDTEDGDDNDTLEDSGVWTPGQGTSVDLDAIIGILLSHLDSGSEDVQATCLRWISSFIVFFPQPMLSFTPRIISYPLKRLAHESYEVLQAASETNSNLYRVIQSLETPSDPQQGLQPSTASQSPAVTSTTHPPTTNVSDVSPQVPNVNGEVSVPSSSSASSFPHTAKGPSQTPSQVSSTDNLATSSVPGTGSSSPVKLNVDVQAGKDPFDYVATVQALGQLFLAPEERTRVAALGWLQMLHLQAPRKVMPRNEDSLGLLLATLSDSSEEVVKADLQLLAQISSLSETKYFETFMRNLNNMFSTDRKLLETRGSLIIKQLCLSLNTERIYRTFAEILEDDEDLEFASIMVQNLNMIVITSPELSDFRKRLKNLESRDGQMLFSILYRSWSHNAVATFTLCLLAQAYEHASNLLQIFADLEITVNLLAQIDKLVQLLESPVFTSLRLQLLEPAKNPYLLKSLYGLLMLLPQSSAFVTLRNRLNAVSALGYLHSMPKQGQQGKDSMTTASATTATSTSSTSSSGAPVASGNRSKRNAEDTIKWNDLLAHFRTVQLRHERARKESDDAGTGGSGSGAGGFPARSNGSKALAMGDASGFTVPRTTSPTISTNMSSSWPTRGATTTNIMSNSSKKKGSSSGTLHPHSSFGTTGRPSTGNSTLQRTISGTTTPTLHNTRPNSPTLGSSRRRVPSARKP